MKIFTLTDEVQPPAGTYRRWEHHKGVSAVIACPDCGQRGSLAANHKIGEDGCVVPSVVLDCGFHDFIRLEGWTP